jgi:hypothetical protein
MEQRMCWSLTNDHGDVVAGPYPTVHDVVAERESCPYVRLHAAAGGAYDIDVGFSASDHDHYRLVETA